METKEQSYKFRYAVAAFPLIIMGIIIILGYADEKLFVKVMWDAFKWLMNNWGWLINIGAFAFLVFCVSMLFHPAGKVRFGGETAKPEFKTWNWWAISLCAGIGIGIVMWPAPETLSFASKPARGMFLEPGSHQTIVWALRKAMLHWTFVPYATYLVFGIVIGYTSYNLKKPFTVSSSLYPLLGDRAYGKFGTFIDGITLFAICGGVAGSLGYGLLQLGRSLDFVFGIEPGPPIWYSIGAFVIASYTLSSVTGLKRGVQWLSDKNTWMYIILLFFVVMTGPAAFMANLTIQAFGSMINNFFIDMTLTDPFPGTDMWPQWWDMYVFVDWMSWGPIMGMFLARMAYGRTIREFVVVNLIIPGIFGVIWFGIFGALTMHVQYIQNVDLVSLMDTKGMEVLMLKLFDFMPLTNIVRPFMILVILISFITCADSVTSTVSLLCLDDYDTAKKEAPTKIKIFWGVLMGMTAMVFLLNGGIEGLKIVKTMAGVPILLIETAVMIGFYWFWSRGQKTVFSGVESPISTKPKTIAQAEI